MQSVELPLLVCVHLDQLFVKIRVLFTDLLREVVLVQRRLQLEHLNIHAAFPVGHEPWYKVRVLHFVQEDLIFQALRRVLIRIRSDLNRLKINFLEWRQIFPSNPGRGQSAILWGDWRELCTVGNLFSLPNVLVAGRARLPQFSLDLQTLLELLSLELCLLLAPNPFVFLLVDRVGLSRVSVLQVKNR